MFSFNSNLITYKIQNNNNSNNKIQEKNNNTKQPKQKKQKKHTIIKNYTGYITQQNLNIISINIGDELKNKIEGINSFIDKNNPDIMCLVETHTYYEDFQTIKGWLERKKYKVFYTSKS
jgi:hypothetical protein